MEKKKVQLALATTLASLIGGFIYLNLDGRTTDKIGDQDKSALHPAADSPETTAVRGFSQKFVALNDAAEPNQSATVSIQKDGTRSQCIPVQEFLNSVEAKEIDDWYMSWGAPPNFNTELASRPYAYYEFETLDSLSKQGDAVASHELGLAKVWNALHGHGRLPDYKTLWDAGADDIPYATEIDLAKLEEGRTHLYEAALEGRFYALTEIGLSYVHEKVAKMNAGTLTPEEKRELEILAYAFSNAPERIIDGLHSNFVQIRVDSEMFDEAIVSLDFVHETYFADRNDRFPESRNLPTTSTEDVQIDHNICLNFVD